MLGDGSNSRSLVVFFTTKAHLDALNRVPPGKRLRRYLVSDEDSGDGPELTADWAACNDGASLCSGPRLPER